MLERLLLEFGYTDRDIIMIKYNRDLSKYSEEELCNRVKSMFNCLSLFGYNREEIVKMTTSCSSLLSLTMENINKKIRLLSSVGYSEDEIRTMIKSNPRILIIDDKQIIGVIDTLISFGNSNEMVKGITKNYPGIFNEYDSLEDRFNGLITLGLDRECINDITCKNPSIYGFRYNEYISKINYLKDIGFSLTTIIKLVKESSFFGFIMLDDIKKKVREFDILGFSVKDIDKMILVYPNIFVLNLSDVIEKIQHLSSLGFSYSNVNVLLKNNARLFYYSNENIKERIDLFYVYDFSFSDVSDLVLKCPAIFDMDFVNLVRKLEFFKVSRLSKMIISNPEILFYCIEDMYSRYMYLTSKGVKINSKNNKILFVSNDEFINKYDVNYEEVIDNYKNNRLLSGYSLRKSKKKND